MIALLRLLFCLSFLISSTAPSSATYLRPPVPRFLGSSSATEPRPRLTKYRYETKYFTQTLDHFSFADLPAFQQRYLFSSDHWAGPGSRAPIFFYCGNEGGIDWFAANTGFVWEIAPRFRALVVFAEHRYYGESMPFGSQDAAYSNASSLSYLTTEQALADFATLITNLKRNLSAENSPVVLFGGSYGGMMAAWMRLKYPHIAIGALASSAPILQFEDIVPPETFYDTVSNDFRAESLSCFETIKASWDELEVEANKTNGLQKLSRTFRLCRDLNSVQSLSDWLNSAYSYLAMVCKQMDKGSSGKGILERILAGVSIYYNYTGDVKCFDINDDPHGMDGWNWQACTEMIMPMSCSKDSMFPEYNFDYSAYRDQCMRDYGARPRPRWITTEFGGHDIKKTLRNFGSNIIFSNGLLDPWSGGGVLQNISSSIVALVTKLGAHHIDLRPATENDPDWLIQLRQSEISMIKSWVDDYYQEKKLSSSI